MNQQHDFRTGDIVVNKFDPQFKYRIVAIKGHDWMGDALYEAIYIISQEGLRPIHTTLYQNHVVRYVADWSEIDTTTN